MQPCGDYLFGLELVTQVWFELLALGAQEWEETNDDKRFGKFHPDFAASAAHERNANIGVVTMRERSGGRLVGYFVGTVGRPLKTAGETTFNEVGVYIHPDHRAGRLFNHFIKYVELAAQHFGCTGMIISHRPDAPRIGKLYERCGYEPISVDYFKKLARGSDETQT